VAPTVNWYDLVVVVALLYGVWTGLRAGLMGEIIRVVGLILMIALAFALYKPVGDLIGDHSQLSDDNAHLLAFVSIAAVVYLISLAVRLATHRHMQKFKLGSLIESVGGAFAGVVRMLVIMTWVTILLAVSSGEFMERSVGQESRFGSFVVSLLPALKPVAEKSLPEKLWIREEPKHSVEANADTTASTNTDSNRPQPNTP